MSETCVMSIQYSGCWGRRRRFTHGAGGRRSGSAALTTAARSLSISADLYSAPQHVGLIHGAQVAPEATLAAPGGRSMQDPASELLRIPLPRTSVNRRERLQRLLGVSRKIFDFCPSDDTVGIGTETRNRSEQRLRGSPSSNGRSLEAGWASSATGYSCVSGE